MFNQLRVFYPKSSLLTELVTIKHGKYLVRALVQVEGATIATGMAAAETVELAEDQARDRVFSFLGIQATPAIASGIVDTQLPVTEKTLPLISNSANHLSSKTDTETQGHTTTGSFNNNELTAHELTPTVTPLSFSDTQHLVISSPTNQIEPEPEPDEVETTQPEPVLATISPLPTSGKILDVVEPTLEPASQPTSKSKRKSSSSESQTNNTTVPGIVTPVDMSDIIAKTTVEIKRLGWSNQKGRDYLMTTYNKRGRSELTDEELQEFLYYLESQPNPED